MASLQDFGVIKNKRGIEYLYTPNTHVGIRADAVKSFRGVVKRFTSLLQWWEVEVEGLEQAFLIHNLWVRDYGELRVGEEIEGVIHIRHSLGWVAWYVRRVAKEKEGVIAV